MKWIVLITTVLFYADLFLLYKIYNLIILPLLIGGTVCIGIILLSILISKQSNFDKKYKTTRIDANKYSVDKW